MHEMQLCHGEMKESRVHFACEILNIRWTKVKNNLVRMENYEMFDDRAFFLFFNLNKL